MFWAQQYLAGQIYFMNSSAISGSFNSNKMGHSTIVYPKQEYKMVKIEPSNNQLSAILSTAIAVALDQRLHLILMVSIHMSMVLVLGHQFCASIFCCRFIGCVAFIWKLCAYGESLHGFFVTTTMNPDFNAARCIFWVCYLALLWGY